MDDKTFFDNFLNVLNKELGEEKNILSNFPLKESCSFCGKSKLSCAKERKISPLKEAIKQYLETSQKNNG